MGLVGRELTAGMGSLSFLILTETRSDSSSVGP